MIKVFCLNIYLELNSMNKIFITLILIYFSQISIAQENVAQEQLIFSCQLRNKAIITVHRSHHKEPNYTYRFTRNGKVELKLTQTQTQTQMHLNSRIRMLQFRGNGLNVFFPNGKYGYNVFSYFEIPEKEEDPIIFRDGVYVSKDDDYYYKEIYCHRTFKSLSEEDLY